MKEIHFDEIIYTVRDTRSTVDHLREMRRFAMLDRNEERRLIGLMLQGGRDGEAARAKLINSQLRLVVSIAKHNLVAGLMLDDLIAAGEEGLVRAVNSLRRMPYGGLATYVRPFVQGAMLDAIAEWYNPSGVPERTLSAIRGYEQQLARMDEESESMEGMAAYLEQLREARDKFADSTDPAVIKPYHSLDVSASRDDDEHTLADTVADDDARADADLDREENRRSIRALMTLVAGKQATDILLDKFGFNGPEYSDGMLCEKYGLSQHQLDVIVKAALQKLREDASAPLLRRMLMR